MGNWVKNEYFDAIIIGTSLTLNGYEVTDILDEDDMASDSDTALATQQSIKAYVDTSVAAENLWDRTGTTLYPHTAGDSIQIDDNAKLKLGDSDDAAIYFDGVDLRIDPNDGVAGSRTFHTGGLVIEDVYGNATVTAGDAINVYGTRSVFENTEFIIQPSTGSAVTYVQRAFGAGANIGFTRAQGTKAAPTTIGNGNIIGKFEWRGYHSDNSAYNTGVKIQATVDASIGGSAESPMRLEFYTTPNASITPALRMTLTSDEILDIDCSIDADYTSTATTGTVNIFDFDGFAVPASASSGFYRGLSSNIKHTGGQNITGSLTGQLMQATCDSNSTLATARAGQYTVSNTDAGTITKGEGIALSHFNSGGGTFTDYFGIVFKQNNATNVYAFDFQDVGFVSNGRSVSAADDGAQRYMPLSTADTGITFDSNDLVLATTTSGDVNLAPNGNLQVNGTNGLSGTLTLDDGANWRVTLTFTKGVLTGQTTGASSGATGTWV